MRRRAAVLLGFVLSGLFVTLGLATPALAACSNSTGGSSEVTYTTGGESRKYLLFVPSGLTATGRVPLLLSLHGADATTTPLQAAKNHRTETGWNAIAQSKKFIVAYPVAASLNWRIARNSADVAFLNSLVDRIATTKCISLTRVHIEGYSRGGLMSQRMACDSAGKIASVASYAAGSPSLTSGTPCSPSRGIGIGLFQSTLDPVSTLPLAILNRDEWRNRNDCPANGSSESGIFVEATTWKPCKGGVEVFWRLYGISGHAWPASEPDHTDITTRMWSLFTRNPLP